MSSLAAYRAAQRHTHVYSPYGEGMESCTCGLIRLALEEAREEDEVQPVR